MKFIGDGLGRQKKAKWGILWDWTKSETEKHTRLLHLVGIG